MDDVADHSHEHGDERQDTMGNAVVVVVVLWCYVEPKQAMWAACRTLSGEAQQHTLKKKKTHS